MISLATSLPALLSNCVEAIKINCTYNSYRDIALFWTQDKNRAVISMLDGNMVILNNSANIEELREFIGVISPASVFSDANTLQQLFNGKFHRVYVMKSEYNFTCNVSSQSVNSSEIYKLLNVRGLELPPYEHFAVDFCHRLNHGKLKFFALKENCAAIGIFDGQAVLVNGIASHKKGMGTVALCGLLSQYNALAFAVCEQGVMQFYLKNNFSHIYDAGYWRKNLELL